MTDVCGIGEEGIGSRRKPSHLFSFPVVVGERLPEEIRTCMPNI